MAYEIRDLNQHVSPLPRNARDAVSPFHEALYPAFEAATP